MHATVASSQALANDLHRFWGLLMRTSQGEWFRTVVETDLSLTQLKAMFMVNGCGEGSVKAVAESLGLSLAAASRSLDGLVQRGLMERRESEADRRSRLLRLTDDGRAVVQRLMDARLAGLESFVETLEEDERLALTAALRPVLERMAP